jgi:polar amino acid transport system substrate-binding protein
VAAADPTWPPFSWRDPLGEFHGFDVEVTREIARRLGARAEFVTPSWEELTEADWDGRWDIAVASVTPTAGRRARLDFPAIYAWSFAALAVPAGEAELRAPGDLDGKRIGVLEDTIYEAFLRGEPMQIDGLPEVAAAIEPGAIVTFADTAAPYRSLDEGRLVDAVVDDLVAVKEQIARGRPIRVLGEPLFAAPAAVAIEKGDPELAAEIARIVAEMHADGALRALSSRWFGPEHDEASAGLTN